MRRDTDAELGSCRADTFQSFTVWKRTTADASFAAQGQVGWRTVVRKSQPPRFLQKGTQFVPAIAGEHIHDQKPIVIDRIVDVAVVLNVSLERLLL